MTPYFANELATLYHGDGIEVLPSILARGSVDAMSPFALLIGALLVGWNTKPRRQP